MGSYLLVWDPSESDGILYLPAYLHLYVGWRVVKWRHVSKSEPARTREVINFRTFSSRACLRDAYQDAIMDLCVRLYSFEREGNIEIYVDDIAC